MKLSRLILVFILIFLAYSLIKNAFDYHRNIQFYQNYKDAYLKEYKANITLKTQLLKENSSTELEKTIRNKLNLLRPGEIAVIPPDPAVTVTPPTLTPVPNYQQWWNFFFQKQ